MKIQELLKKPLFYLTTEEFLFISNKDSPSTNTTIPKSATPKKRYVYGLLGLATLFNCSIPTAGRLKRSKKIDAAISQIGRKIIVDADLALTLVKINNKKK